MNNLSRVIVILASLASLVAIVWMVTRAPSYPPTPPDAVEPVNPVKLVGPGADLTDTKSGPIEVDPDPGRYPAINDTRKIQNVRRPQHVYETEVVGQVAGDASNKDWGMKGEVKFRLTYRFKSVGEVLSNDGRTIVESRRFEYKEVLIIDSIRAGLELSESQAWVIGGVVGVIGEIVAGGSTFGGQIVAAKEFINTANGKMYEIPPEVLKAAAAASRLTGISSLDLEKNLKAVLPKPEFGILDGKTVRLTFEDGKGITRIEPVNCSISSQEELVITRANNLSDHYIFPDRTRAPGQAWEVPADNLGSLVDPRLRGSIVNSSVRLKRTDDTLEKGDLVVNVSIDGTQRIMISKTGEGREVTGEMTVEEARFKRPEAEGVVTEAHATGTVEYRDRTTDHLLFGAEIRGRPTFEVVLRTIVRKQP